MTNLTIFILGCAGLVAVLYVVISEWLAHRQYIAHLKDIEARAARLAAREQGRD